MFNDISRKQFLNFRNTRNKRKHDTMNPMMFFTIFFSPAFTDDEIEQQIVSVTAEAVADTVKERPAKTIF